MKPFSILLWAIFFCTPTVLIQAQEKPAPCPSWVAIAKQECALAIGEYNEYKELFSPE